MNSTISNSNPNYTMNTAFSDENGDEIIVKISTEPFVKGNINDVINWMVKYQYGHVNMEDNDGGYGYTFFFIACLHNPNDDLIKWLIETNEADLDYENYFGLNVIEFLAFNIKYFDKAYEEFIEKRAKLILDMHTFDFNKKDNDSITKFQKICRNGNYKIVKHLVTNNHVKLDLQIINDTVNNLNQLINQLKPYSSGYSKFIEKLKVIINYLNQLANNFVTQTDI